MAVMDMVAVTMIGPREEMEPAARQMLRAGCFQPISVDQLLTDRRSKEKIRSGSKNPYDDLLARTTSIWTTAGLETPAPSPIATSEIPTLDALSEQADEMTASLAEISERVSRLTDEIETAESLRALIAACDAAGISSSKLADTEYLSISLGSMPADGYERLIASSADAPMLASELVRSGGSVWALVFAPPGYVEGAKKLMNAVAFHERDLPELLSKISSDAPLEELDSKIKSLRDQLSAARSAATDLIESRRSDCEALYSNVYTMQRIYDVCRSRGETGGTFILSGWMPEASYTLLRPTLEEDAPHSTIIMEHPAEMPRNGAKIPTMLSNNPLVRAFQDVVAMYSVPSYGEVDPSPFVALTFIIFFGSMFGDIGHGALLFLGSWYLDRRGILNGALSFVMKCASVSSMVFGVLYGSIMGVEDVFPALWLSPMHDTPVLFGTAILAGVVMLSVGMIINIAVCFKRREFGRMLFDGQGLAGLIVYWSAVAAAAISVLGIDSPIPPSALWALFAVMLLVTALKGLLSKHLLHEEEEEHVSGAMQAFEVLHSLMNYFTNTASFVRLAAFALNHVALSFAVMLISDMMAALPGGPVLKGIVLVVGNIFIVGLEGLIVFIQVLRLEYYEFFSKFYRGGGSAFRPVQWER